MRLLSLLVTAILLFGSYSAPLFGQCNPCPADRDKTTNCIETEIEVASKTPSTTCYRLIVYNNQFSTSSNPLCSQYNTERFLTMEFLNAACYDSVDVQITPVKANTWHFDLGGVTYTSYSNSVGHPNKIIWQRNNTPPPPAPDFKRCEIDTFLICINCITKGIDSTCANGGFDFKVYFSDAAGDPSCVNETTGGRTYERIGLRPPVCNLPSCGLCTFYGSTCNSWDVTFGCDYAEITIINDHSFPQCSPLKRIEFWVGGMSLCTKANNPKFRDWVTTQKDTLDRTYLAFTSPNQGLKPCDSFKIRIPFCCTEEDSTMYIQPGEGFCGYWGPGSGSGGSGGGNPPRIQHTFPKLDCPDCYLDKDEGRLGRSGIPGSCDTLIICNKNTSNTQCGGSKGTGNTKFTRVVIDVGTPCTVIGVLPPHLATGWTVTPPTPPSTVWIANGPPIEPCDCIKFLLCGCSNLDVVKWITITPEGDTITVDSTGGWDEEPPSNPGIPPKKLVAPETPTIGSASSIGSSVVASVGEPVPNPTTGLTTIPLTLAAGSGPALVSIYGADGNLVGTKQQNIRIGLNELQIDGSGWPSGSYRVRVQIGETVMNKVFILRR